MKERFQATLAGCAVGDSLGMPVEGWKREHIAKYVGKVTEIMAPVIARDAMGKQISEDEHGKVKYWTRKLKKGDYTDDTILTFAIARSLANRKSFDLDDIAHEHVMAINDSSAFGGTTKAAIERIKNGFSPKESGVIGGPGNAPGMKMSPIGLYMQATGNYDEGLKIAEEISRMTHLDPRSIASGVVQAHAVYSLLNGISRENFINSVVRVCEENESPLTEEFTWYKSGNLLSRLEWIEKNKDADPEEAYKILGSSSAVYQSYPFAIFMFQKYWDNPIEGLIETVNFGGDCDTTGAIYGALAGAKNGLIFPGKWMREISGLEEAFELGEKIFSLGGIK